MVFSIDPPPEHAPRTALVDSLGECRYQELAQAAGSIAETLLDGRDNLEQARVALLAPPGREYVAALKGIWAAGGIAVPLCISHPRPEWEYVLRDTGSKAVLLHADFHDHADWISRRVGRILPSKAPPTSRKKPLVAEDPDRRALILYTSGTTSRPKGVVSTVGNLRAQVSTLLKAWDWRCADRILHVLPLHHTHGVVNALLCPLQAGACCEMFPAFDAEKVWERIASGRITVFMAVPTVYARLISFWKDADSDRRSELSRAAARLRLTVSGSAALPVSSFEAWREISGSPLLERYGMTEIGMALSNPYRGRRRAGFVGRPLPGVDVRLVDAGQTLSEEGVSGEIQVRGPSVFLEYWNRPDETKKAFCGDWFKTGDVALREEGDYRILGRRSVDIIKTGGYKVSALEIEEALRNHPAISECAVVGMPDPEWGERVSAAVVAAPGLDLKLDEMRRWGKSRLAPYKIPSRLILVEDLPRNALGKVVKPSVKKFFESNEAATLPQGESDHAKDS